MPLIVSNATVIDGVAPQPLEGRSILIDEGRIKALGQRDELGAARESMVVDARGKFVIPGLMNANVHLFGDVRLETLVRHMGNYEAIILESAQVALKQGLTTVFDTWGPRRFLMAARDRINAGTATGSRIYCAGNIIGFDGPFSPDFHAKATDVASGALANRVNAIWVENVGRHLMWLTPEQVAREVRTYIGKGIDFVKYGSNEHFGNSHGAFLAFSERVQAAMVAEAHRAGITAQAHTMSAEGLRMAVEAGCDLAQHANHTGPVAIPQETLELIARRNVGVVLFPQMQARLDWLTSNESYRGPNEWQTADTNARNLIRCGARLLLGNDGLIYGEDALNDPQLSKIIRTQGTPGEDNLFDLATGHFVWLQAMEEKGCPPMEALKAATHNIAVAYGKDEELGTLQPGKVADLLVLNRNPLEAAANYRSIHMVIKDGKIVDREGLPDHPVLTKPVEGPVAEEASYVSFLSGGSKLPMCPLCLNH